jgi:hypothetical protein
LPTFCAMSHTQVLNNLHLIKYETPMKISHMMPTSLRLGIHLLLNTE